MSVKKIILLIFLFCFVSHAEKTSSTVDTPITIICKNSQSSETMLSLELNLKNNFAHLFYQMGTQSPLNMTIRRVSGIYSSSSVSFSTTSTGSFIGRKTFTVDASMSEIYRVTHFGDFSLVLVEDSDGKISPARLIYDYGVVEIDGKDPQTIDLSKSDLTCEISGI